MTESHLFLIISAILGTAIVIFGSVYYFTNRWVEVQREKIKAAQIPVRETKQSGTDLKRHYFPLQVDAYQRMVLFLERIAPNNMIIRLSNPGLPARAFQQKLLENIRQEYDHNLAQQIFISKTAWSNVQASKEEIVKIINMASINLDDTALANELAKNIFEITAQLKAQPTDQAIDFLKSELNKILG